MYIDFTCWLYNSVTYPAFVLDTCQTVEGHAARHSLKVLLL